MFGKRTTPPGAPQPAPGFTAPLPGAAPPPPAPAAAPRVSLAARAPQYGPAEQARFASETLDVLGSQVRLAASTTTETADRLSAFEDDAELPTQLALQTHEVMLALRDADGIDVVALGDLKVVA